MSLSLIIVFSISCLNIVKTLKNINQNQINQFNILINFLNQLELAQHDHQFRVSPIQQYQIAPSINRLMIKDPNIQLEVLILNP